MNNISIQMFALRCGLDLQFALSASSAL